MNEIQNISKLLVLGIIVYQDFKERAVSWFLYPILLGIFIFSGIGQKNMLIVLENFFLNLGFIAFQLLTLFIYFSIKNKRLTNIVNTHLGIGDILFMVAIAAGFSLINYIIFQVISFVIVVFGFGILKMANKNADPEIPLAGAMALFLTTTIFFEAIINIDFFNDSFFLDLMMNNRFKL